MLFTLDASSFRLVWHAPDMAVTDTLHRRQWCKAYWPLCSDRINWLCNRLSLLWNYLLQTI